jgi:hypothetical protein
MLDFRIIVAAIIVCVSLVMIGTRVLTTSDAFNIAAGSRPGIRTMSDPVRPSIAVMPATPATAELPAPSQSLITLRPSSPATPVAPISVAKSRLPAEAPRSTSVAGAPADDVTGSIPAQPGPADVPARRSPGSGAPAHSNRATATPPVSELSGSIFSHPESQPNVEPDWKQNPALRSAVAPAPPPARQAEEPVKVLEFFFKNSTAR